MAGSNRPETEEARFSSQFRLACMVIVAVAIAWDFVHAGAGSNRWAISAFHAAEILVVLASWRVARKSRSMKVLRALAFVVGAAVMVTGFAITVLEPSTAWENTFFAAAAVIFASMMVPWSLRWQTALALLAVSGTMISLELARHATTDHATMLRVNGALIVVAIVSLIMCRATGQNRDTMLASQERYRTIFAASGDAIALLSRDLILRDGNPQLALLLARPLDDLVGKPLAHFLAATPGADSSEAGGAPAMLMALTSGATARLNIRLARPDGAVLEAEGVATAFLTRHGEEIQLILRDVSQRRSDDLQRSERLRVEGLSRVAGGIAHQFNNVLSGILAEASLLVEDAVGEEERRSARAILESARRGRGLTKVLQRFTEHQQLTLRKASPCAILEGAADQARLDMPANMTLRIDCPAGLPDVMADTDHLAQALHELATNSVRALAAAATPLLTFAAAPAQDADGRECIAFSVSDNGEGMDAETLAQAAEPFGSNRPLYEAAGVGLPAVYWIAKAHGGSVSVRSERGRGTTIELRIPTRQLEQPAPRIPATTTVLVVDDEESVRSATTRVLTRLGYTVREAVDGPSALAALGRPGEVHLVVLDIVLPGGGSGLVRRMIEHDPELRILATSGYGPEGEATKMLAAGAHGFIQKPYEIPELRAAVQQALG